MEIVTIKQHNEDLKRYLGALHEEHGTWVKIIDEHFNIIHQKLDRHEGILESHTEMIGKLAMDMTTVKQDLKEMRSDMRKMNRRVAGVEKKVEV